MKKTMLVMAVLALVAMTGYSEDAKETKEPAELTAAKKAYAEQIEKVTAPVRAKQIATLQKLQKQLTVKGDLQGALAVQNEIEAINSGKTGPPTMESFTGEWTYGDPAGWSFPATFKKEGSTWYMVPGNGGKKREVSLKDGKLYVTTDDNAVLEQDPDDPNRWIGEHLTDHGKRQLVRKRGKTKK